MDELAIRLLDEDRDSGPLGLRGPRGGDFCGQFIDLSPSKLEEAVLSPALVQFKLNTC